MIEKRLLTYSSSIKDIKELMLFLDKQNYELFLKPNLSEEEKEKAIEEKAKLFWGVYKVDIVKEKHGQLFPIIAKEAEKNYKILTKAFFEIDTQNKKLITVSKQYINQENIFAHLDYEPLNSNKIQILLSLNNQSDNKDITYGSQTYYDAIITDKCPYEGYKSVYVGLGSMVMKNDKNEEIKLHSNSHNWLEDCWYKFIIEIEERKSRLLLKSQKKATKSKTTTQGHN